LGQLFSIFAVTLFTLSSIAQTGLGSIPKTDFSPLIDQNILEQELTAEEVAKSTQFASAAEEDDTALVESVKTVPTGNGEAALAAQKQAEEQNQASDGTRKPANEKDFQLKLHPTGLASAKRYFPPKPPKPPKAKVVKTSKKSAKVAKAEKSEKKTKVKKSKSNGRSTASIKKKSKNTKSTRNSSSVKI
jgi:hypothetical protein